MEIFFIWATSVALSLLWFFIILKIGKHTVGKAAQLWQILTFLVIAGPIGWAVVIIMIATELVDQAFNLKKK